VGITILICQVAPKQADGNAIVERGI